MCCRGVQKASNRASFDESRSNLVCYLGAENHLAQAALTENENLRFALCRRLCDWLHP